MLRRILLLMFVVTACTSNAPPDPARVDTCADMVSAATKLIEQYLDAVSDQPLEVVTGEVPPTERIAELDAVSAGFDQRIAQLGCDPADVSAGVIANLAEVEPENPAGELLLDLVRSGPSQSPTETSVPPTTLVPSNG